MAVLSPLRVWRGETKVFKFTVIDVDTGLRVDLRTYDGLEFQVKTDVEVADPPLIAKTLTGGVELLDQTDEDTKGQCTVTLLPSDTSGVGTPEGAYEYDFWGIIGSARYLLGKPSTFMIEGVVNGA